jgi:carnosine N-methyltransferase
MLLASNYILNQTTSPFSNLIFPNLHSFSNHPTTSEHLLRRVLIPDIVPSEVLGDGSGEFSLVAGDFEEIYGTGDEGEDGEGQKGQWGGVVTCFFIDCVCFLYSLIPGSAKI